MTTIYDIRELRSKNLPIPRSDGKVGKNQSLNINHHTYDTTAKHHFSMSIKLWTNKKIQKSYEYNRSLGIIGINLFPQYTAISLCNLFVISTLPLNQNITAGSYNSLMSCRNSENGNVKAARGFALGRRWKNFWTGQSRRQFVNVKRAYYVHRKFTPDKRVVISLLNEHGANVARDRRGTSWLEACITCWIWLWSAVPLNITVR